MDLNFESPGMYDDNLNPEVNGVRFIAIHSTEPGPVVCKLCVAKRDHGGGGAEALCKALGPCYSVYFVEEEYATEDERAAHALLRIHIRTQS